MDAVSTRALSSPVTWAWTSCGSAHRPSAFRLESLASQAKAQRLWRPMPAHNERSSMDESQPIRVVIVDDHDMIRSGLAVFLAAFDDLKLVGEATDGNEAIRLCDEVKPDVALMDLVMPQMDGVAAIRAIRQAHPDTQVIALTSFSDQHL